MTTVSRKGFSLLELLVVIVLIVILSGGALPVFMGGAVLTNEQSAVDRHLQLAGLAQSIAVTEGKTARLEFLPAERQVAITVQENPLEDPTLFSPAALGSKAIYTLPERLDYQDFRIDDFDLETAEEDEVAAIHFYRDGSAESETVVIGATEEDAVTLIFSEMTGRVRVLQENLILRQEEEGVTIEE